MNKSEIPVAQRAVLSMLLDDHREVKKLFKTFQQEKDKPSGCLLYTSDAADDSALV